jgi:hypothetical protein
MNLKDILAISGHSGLFRFISQGRNGVIVEGLIDKKRMNATSSMRISALDDVAIFTTDKEVPLKEVFRKIFQKENGQPCIDPKSPEDKLKAYFVEILPDYDKDKVYVSDMKKVYNWYNILLGQKMIDLEEDKPEETKDALAEGEHKEVEHLKDKATSKPKVAAKPKTESKAKADTKSKAKTAAQQRIKAV